MKDTRIENLIDPKKRKKLQLLVDFMNLRPKDKKDISTGVFWGWSCTVPVLEHKDYTFSIEGLLESTRRGK